MSMEAQRRTFLKRVVGGIPAAFLFQKSFGGTTAKKTVRIVEFNEAGMRTGVVEVEKIEKPDAEWKKTVDAGAV